MRKQVPLLKARVGHENPSGNSMNTTTVAWRDEHMPHDGVAPAPCHGLQQHFIDGL